MSFDKRLAVVIFNLGGPDKPEAIQPFVFNLFYDPAILMLPNPIRWILAKIISTARAPKSKEIYDQVGGKSTLLPATNAQAQALKKEIGNFATESEIFVFMRYWKPDVKHIVQKIKKYDPDNIILIPLYPQFSTTTTGTSIKAFKREADKIGLNAPQDILCCYPSHEGFLNPTVENIKKGLEQAEQYGNPRLLLSAHGLPEKTIKSGDPYQWQVEETSAAIVEALNITNLDHVTCYQSRVGPVKWITPSTEYEIVKAGKDKVPIVIAPIAFVSEHVETLVEIDKEYRDLSIKTGVPFFYRAPAVATDCRFIKGLGDLIQKSLSGNNCTVSETIVRKCPVRFTTCPNNVGLNQISS